jgi:hypothetical protein
MASTQFLEVQDTPSREVQALREVIKSTSRTLDEMQKMFPTCDQRTSLVVEACSDNNMIVIVSTLNRKSLNSGKDLKI